MVKFSNNANILVSVFFLFSIQFSYTHSVQNKCVWIHTHGARVLCSSVKRKTRRFRENNNIVCLRAEGSRCKTHKNDNVSKTIRTRAPIKIITIVIYAHYVSPGFCALCHIRAYISATRWRVVGNPEAARTSTYGFCASLLRYISLRSSHTWRTVLFSRALMPRPSVCTVWHPHARCVRATDI